MTKAPDFDRILTSTFSYQYMNPFWVSLFSKMRLPYNIHSHLDRFYEALPNTEIFMDLSESDFPGVKEE